MRRICVLSHVSVLTGITVNKQQGCNTESTKHGVLRLIQHTVIHILRKFLLLSQCFIRVQAYRNGKVNMIMFIHLCLLIILRNAW